MLAPDRELLTGPWMPGYRLLTVLVMGALLAACGAADGGGGDGAESASAIIGDLRTDREQPQVVELEVEESGKLFTCTGTLIGKHTVLTARHCVAGRIDEANGCTITVLLDRLGRSTNDPATERYPAARCDMLDAGGIIAAHEDLATVRLARDVAAIAPVQLATDAAPRGHYTAYGYGSFGVGPTFGTKCGHGSDGHKRKVTYDGELGFRLGHQATCPGDSGGPHFVSGTSVLAGVTSTGYSAGVAYEANTSVATHRAWILERLAAYGDAPAR